MIKLAYNQYIHATQRLHHHTITVLGGVLLFVGLFMWHIVGQLIPPAIAQASGPLVDMSISNTAIPSQVNPGSTVTFFYYYQNESLDINGNGNVPTTINISADIPAGMSFVDATPAPSSATSSSLTRNNVGLTDRAYGFIIVQMQIAQNPPGSMTQTVSLSMPANTDPIPANNQQSSTITVLSQSQGPAADVDLLVEKIVANTGIVGQPITYTINYQNIGTTPATNVSIIDVIPAGTQFIDNGLIGITAIPAPTTVTGTYNEVYIRNIGALNPGQGGTIILTGIITPGLPDGFGLINLIQITSSQNDSDPQNNFDYTLTTVAAVGADLSLQKSASANTVSIGQTFSYNMLITNNGPEMATGVVLTDTLPVGLTIIAATGASIVGNTYTWNITQIPAYTSVLRSITVQANQAGTITNAAQVSASTFDPILANNTSSFPVIVQGPTNNTGTNNTGTNNNTGTTTGTGTQTNTNPLTNTTTPSSGRNNLTTANSGSNTHGSAVSKDGAKACMYDDAQYITKGSFTDTIGHRGFPYIEMMRVSCIHKGPGGKKGLWIYEPNRSVTRAEVLKTVVKILGIQFGDFTIMHEDLPYIGEKVFADTPNWFDHYAQYAYTKGLVDGLYTTDKKGNKYIKPDEAITRYEAIKVIMLAYNKIIQSAVSINGRSVLGDIVNPNDPYYNYVRQAETLGFISGVPKINGGYDFQGDRNITRAEFAKIASVPFSDQLFDIAYIVETSSLYQKIIDGLAETTMDKIRFANIVLQEINAISQEEFLYSFKVSKDVFMDVLTEKVLTPLLQ